MALVDKSEDASYHQSKGYAKNGCQNVGPDLVPYCLQRLSADDTSSQRVKQVFMPRQSPKLRH